MQEHTSDNPTSFTSRRRASKACLACRARKVRCDAVHREGPCTNCVLDRRQCVVTPRPSKYRSAKKRSTMGQEESTGPKNGLRRELQSYTTSETLSPNLVDDASLSPERPSDHAQSSPPISCGGSGPALAENPSDQIRYLSPSMETNLAAHEMPDGDPARECSHASSNAYHGSTKQTHVMYSNFPFLKADVSLMSREDVHFLDTQGCFKVPGRQAVDKFVREYFLHVHPSLPLLDESTFWDMYSQSGRSPRDRVSLSLFVFQAMLFVSSSFISPATIRALGFASTRSMRATYYRRAKLLYDFGGEMNAVANAQGALLLSYNASMRDHKRTNSLWLTMAIQLAEASGAHQFHLIPDKTPEERNALKRLWWCCIVRDRILPLGVRRQVLISLNSFNQENMTLTEDDFCSEINSSQVYDAETKTSLIRLFITLCDMAVPLTDVIMTIYPSNEPIDVRLSSTVKLQQALDRIQSCKLGLQSWFEGAIIRFPTPAGIVSASESLILFTNLMYIYYHAARLALYHHEALVFSALSPGFDYEVNELPRSRIDLENAAAGITDNLKELIQLKLTRYLPISVVAYVALPLVLHILDVNFSTTPFQTAQKQGRLNIYMQAMKGLQSQYDGTDEVWGFIRAVVEYATIVSLGQQQLQLPEEPSLLALSDGSTSKPIDSSESPSRTLVPVTDTSDWGHMLLKQPMLYHRLTHTIDLCLSRGRYPEDSDFPLVLKFTHISLYQNTVSNTRDECRSNQDADDASDCHYRRETSANMNPQELKDAPLSNFHEFCNLETSVNDADYVQGDLEIPISLDDFEFDLEGRECSMFATIASAGE